MWGFNYFFPKITPGTQQQVSCKDLTLAAGRPCTLREPLRAEAGRAAGSRRGGGGGHPLHTLTQHCSRRQQHGLFTDGIGCATSGTWCTPGPAEDSTGAELLSSPTSPGQVPPVSPPHCGRARGSEGSGGMPRVAQLSRESWDTSPQRAHFPAVLQVFTAARSELCARSIFNAKPRSRYLKPQTSGAPEKMCLNCSDCGLMGSL